MTVNRVVLDIHSAYYNKVHDSHGEPFGNMCVLLQLLDISSI